jgi:PAS domain S-box-containing protein
MKRRKVRFGVLIALLVGASTLTGTIAGVMLYKTAITQKSEFLWNNVNNLAKLIDAVAHFDRGTFGNPTKAAKATISQIEAAFSDHSSFGRTGEILVGRLQENHLEIFLRYRNHQIHPNLILPSVSAKFDAMRLAVAGKSGVGEFDDAAGRRVLAAYTYVPLLGIGLEMRVEKSEIIQPYIYSGLIVTLASAFIIAVCVFIFGKITRPVLHDLQKYQALTEAVVQSAQDLIITIDGKGFIMLINPAGVRKLGYTEDQIVHRDFALLFDFNDDATSATLLKIRDKHINISADTIVTMQCKNGATFPASITCGHRKYDAMHLTTLVLHDLSARKKTEDRIRHLTHKMIEIKDTEQDEISRELHDTLGTNLVWLKLQAQQLLQEKTDSPEARQLLSNFDETIDAARTLSHSLSPIAIEKLGLSTMLQRLVDRANHIGNIRVTLDLTNMPESLPEKLTFHLFRVIQEGLKNALRHSHASQIRIQGTATDRRLEVTISDNGTGFETGNEKEGLGLALMIERGRLMKGLVEIESKVGHGTEVKIAVPI